MGGATLADVASPVRLSVPVSPELGLATGVCEKPTAAALQVGGLHVASFAEVCE